MRAWRLFALQPGSGMLLAPQVGSPQIAAHLPHRAKPWASRAMWATCLIDPEHEPPAADCFCGVYACPERASLARIATTAAPARVVADVFLGGRITPDPAAWTTGVEGLRAAWGIVLSLEIECPPNPPVPEWIRQRPDILPTVQRKLAERRAWWRDREQIAGRLRDRYGVPVTFGKVVD